MTVWPSRPWGQRKVNLLVAPGDTTLWAGYNMNPVDNEIIDLGVLAEDLPGTPGQVVRSTVLGNAMETEGAGGWNSGAAAFPSETLTTVTIEYWWRPRTGVTDNSVFLEIGANVIELRSRNSGAGLQVVVEGASAFDQNLGITPETWHHIMITYTNGSGGNVYVDGVVHGTAVTNQGNLSGITRLAIGTDASGTLTSEGDLLSPCIFNTIKTAAFAASRYRAGAMAAQYTSLWGAIESTAAEGGVTSQYLSNTGQQMIDGTTRWRVGSDLDIAGHPYKSVYPTVSGYVYTTHDALKLTTAEMLYGTWMGSFYKNGAGDEVNFVLGSSATGAVFNGYYLQFDSEERLRLYERTGAAASTLIEATGLSLQTWYDWYITRTYAGVFTLYYKAATSSTWTTAGTATDTTHTAAVYRQLGASANSRIGWATREGNHAITQLLGVVAP